MNITVSRQELAAAALFTSQDDSRYVLTGVLVEAQANKAPVIVATDGRRLVCIETLADQENPDGVAPVECKFILRRDFVKILVAISKATGHKEYSWVRFTYTPGHKRLSIEFLGGNATLEVDDAMIEGDYPDWHKVVPSKSKKREPITDLALNCKQMADFAKAAELLGSDSCFIQMNLVGKEKEIEVIVGSLEDTFYALITPCKINEAAEYQPEFLSIKEMFPPETEPELTQAAKDKANAEKEAEDAGL